jgi:hypothetical protein
MALTLNQFLIFEDKGHEINCLMGAADILYQCALVNFYTAGYIKVAADVASESFAGITAEKKTSTGAGVETEGIRIIRGSRVWLAHSGAAQTDVGAYFYASADDTLGDGEGTNIKNGFMCVGFKTGYILIDFRDKIKTA